MSRYTKEVPKPIMKVVKDTFEGRGFHTTETNPDWSSITVDALLAVIALLETVLKAKDTSDANLTS